VVLAEFPADTALREIWALGVAAGRARPGRTLVVPPALWRGEAGELALVARAQGVVETAERRLVTRALRDTPRQDHTPLWLAVALGLWALHRLPLCPPVPEELGL
jgi:hypothetical protein